MDTCSIEFNALLGSTTPNSLGATTQALRDLSGGLLVMLSGGGDSVALLDIAVAARGCVQVEAVHVNYGLRGDAGLDQLHCEQLCESLGVKLHVHHAQLPPGSNLQAKARSERYGVARELARARGLDWIATAHTADDQAETVLYRLLSSPGRRALRGMAASNDNVIRPLLDVRRRDLRAYLAERGLGWREDSSNEDPRFARALVRRALGDLEHVHPAAVANINTTAELMRTEEDAVLALVREKLEALRAADGTLPVDELAKLHPSVVALILRELAEQVAGRLVPVSTRRVADMFALSSRGGTRRLDLGGGAVAELAYGRLRVSGELNGGPTLGSASAEYAPLPVPGTHEYYGWQISAETIGGFAAGEESDESTEALTIELKLTDAAARQLSVRGRRPGDRLRPLGLGGSKSLQDVFVDRKIPRGLRDRYPVICCGDEIVWVPGVVVGESVAELPKPGIAAARARRPVSVRITATPPKVAERSLTLVGA